MLKLANSGLLHFNAIDDIYLETLRCFLRDYQEAIEKGTFHASERTQDIFIWRECFKAFAQCSVYYGETLSKASLGKRQQCDWLLPALLNGVETRIGIACAESLGSMLPLTDRGRAKTVKAILVAKTKLQKLRSTWGIRLPHNDGEAIAACCTAAIVITKNTAVIWIVRQSKNNFCTLHELGAALAKPTAEDIPFNLVEVLGFLVLEFNAETGEFLALYATVLGAYQKVIRRQALTGLCI